MLANVLTPFRSVCPSYILPGGNDEGVSLDSLTTAKSSASVTTDASKISHRTSSCHPLSERLPCKQFGIYKIFEFYPVLFPIAFD